MFGLTFLNSLFLWGLIAGLVPVIIHLIKRNRAVKLPFAAMRFLQVDPNKKVKIQNLKQFLLLLMRIVALAVLALAFARPFLENQETAAFWGDEPTAKVILIDNSLSMQVGNNLPAALNKASDLLQACRKYDHATIVQFAETAKVVAEAEVDFATLARHLPERILSSYEATDYMQALQLAESILMESPLTRKQIYLISDFQTNGWQSLNPHWDLRTGIDVDFISVGKNEQPNVAVQDVRIVRAGQTARKGDFLIRVENFSDKAKQTKVVLTVNGKKKSQRQVKINSGDEMVVTFLQVSLPRKYVRGSVALELADDAMLPDNRYFFVLRNTSKSEILAINGEPHRDQPRDELFFFAQAINLPKVARFTLVEGRASNLPKMDLRAYRAVVLANVKELSRSQVERLSYYVRGGGGLIIALGDQVAPNIFNSLFSNISPARLNNRAFNSVDRDNSVILAEVDFLHPIFKPFAEPGQGDPGIAEFYQYFHVTPGGPEAVLASFDDGSPAILERKIGAGKVILLTSSIDSEWNNLPVKAMYLPLLYQTLNYVAAETKGQDAFLVGHPVALRSYFKRPEKERAIVIQTPSGERISVENDYFQRTDAPGIYEVFSNARKKPVAYFAVNLNPDESDLHAETPDKLEARVADVTKGPVQEASLVTGQLGEQQERAQKLWRLGILLGILLLVGETWLANRTYR